MHPLVAALGGLDVSLGRAAFQHKAAGQRRDVGAEGGAGQLLAIGAVAYPDRGRVDLRLPADLAAMAASGDFHRYLLQKAPRPKIPSTGSSPAMTRLPINSRRFSEVPPPSVP